ncbi:MAG: pirin family protein [Deltaproteobacteria bacterium]|nr:pirin family protein [Deltaproteobacteria bacterium]
MTEKKWIEKIVAPNEKHWVGDGFHVSTIFSMHSEDTESISPFLMMDHAASKYFPPTQRKRGVGEHPHRGFETVTFAIKGEVEHRDSGGGGGKITTGGIQWMTAGSGVVHDEFHSREFSQKGGDFEMIQLRVNLPSKFKMTPPRYQSFEKGDFPIIDHGNHEITVKVIAGNFSTVPSPVKTFSPINMYELNGPSSSQLEIQLPVGSNTLVFQLSGKSSIGDRQIEKGNLAILSKSGDSFKLELLEESKVMILNGEPLGEPVAAYGPFVMNTRQELMEAFKDFQAGKMGQLVN